ncbi:metallophosphoesterase [Clostridium sp. FP2]|uniref:metallophosphoesterase family protein n=1 Tax=Clostridium sp. FP2 TaxID=2724481 RepID=UPI0013E922B8|nr:metallophosphoesterase [Clostridium sp. FP2]MBZ9624429.1 metallophosphoesterase [Clostridium sp. FP2]
MIYVTGDTHGSLDLEKFTTTSFAEQKNMTKSDYVIICGDFGMVWNNKKADLYWRQWLNEKPFTTLFVDGNHENFDLLNKFQVKEWNGGKVHFIEESVIHLMRGQVFNIEDNKFFTMGGATSIDKEFRKEGTSWWKAEIPSEQEFDEAINNLEKHNWKVDYVITHTTSLRLMEEMCYRKENNELNSFFDMLEGDLQYKHWYFGHFHRNWVFEDKKHTLLYTKVIRLL